MNVHHRRNFPGHLFRKPVDSSHSSSVAVECSNEESDVLEDSFRFLPFADQFGFEGIFAGIKVSPQLFRRLRNSLHLISTGCGAGQGSCSAGSNKAIQKISTCFGV